MENTTRKTKLMWELRIVTPVGAEAVVGYYPTMSEAISMGERLTKPQNVLGFAYAPRTVVITE